MTVLEKRRVGTTPRRRSREGFGLVLAVAAALACNSPRVDMKDPETFSKSVAALQESLSEDDARRLQEATIVVMADTVKPPVPLLKVKPEQWEQIRARLDGKTPRQIIAMADEIRARDSQAGEAASVEAPAADAAAPAVAPAAPAAAPAAPPVATAPPAPADAPAAADPPAPDPAAAPPDPAAQPAAN